MRPDDAGERITFKTGRGIMEVDRSRIVHFPEGIIGFEGLYRFCHSRYQGLPSVQKHVVGRGGGPDFVVIEPLSIFEDYASMTSSVPLDATGIGDPVDLVLLSIVTLSTNRTMLR